MAPVREHLVYEDFTVSGHCSFDVLFHIVQNNVVLTTLFDKDGNVERQIAHGVLKVQLVNTTAPEKNLLLNISGGAEFTTRPDGSFVTVGQGPWLNFGLANLPGVLLYSHGRFQAVVTPNGEYLLTEFPNDGINVCGLIA